MSHQRIQQFRQGWNEIGLTEIVAAVALASVLGVVLLRAAVAIIY